MGVVVLITRCVSAEGDGMAELDIDLLSKFRCLGTEDRDVLIEDFHSLLSGQMSRQECAFFLEMSNWYIKPNLCVFISSPPMFFSVFVLLVLATADYPPKYRRALSLKLVWKNVIIRSMQVSSDVRHTHLLLLFSLMYSPLDWFDSRAGLRNLQVKSQCAFSAWLPC